MEERKKGRQLDTHAHAHAHAHARAHTHARTHACTHTLSLAGSLFLSFSLSLFLSFSLSLFLSFSLSLSLSRSDPAAWRAPPPCSIGWRSVRDDACVDTRPHAIQTTTLRMWCASARARENHKERGSLRKLPA